MVLLKAENIMSMKAATPKAGGGFGKEQQVCQCSQKMAGGDLKLASSVMKAVASLWAAGKVTAQDLFTSRDEHLKSFRIAASQAKGDTTDMSKDEAPASSSAASSTDKVVPGNTASKRENKSDEENSQDDSDSNSDTPEHSSSESS